jgi:hypothetical protein
MERKGLGELGVFTIRKMRVSVMAEPRARATPRAVFLPAPAPGPASSALEPEASSKVSIAEFLATMYVPTMAAAKRSTERMLTLSPRKSQPASMFQNGYV